jgi:hypothetical protein
VCLLRADGWVRDGACVRGSPGHAHTQESIPVREACLETGVEVPLRSPSRSYKQGVVGEKKRVLAQPVHRGLGRKENV